ncbi:hypothetical protein NV379_16685 [Paenibacillus sp. N1-5-1-14]|uniref:hypothetical protein n=1 Tax=Paenibacillus radicibacter TaxID=2972488 RepID=UPI002158D891|nr:hypothetical protein [Paenibacillus radicibacter]MCR8644291.1 hypothetical protein [Paenibacillus radicibacter]
MSSGRMAQPDNSEHQGLLKRSSEHKLGTPNRGEAQRSMGTLNGIGLGAGKVAATIQMNGVLINDDPKLEQEANDMGAKIAQMKIIT